MRLLLQRYLAAQFILPLLVSLLFFVGFLLTFELFRLTGLLMSRDIGIGFLGQLLGNLALSFIPLALPLSTFFSIMFCMSKLSTDSEYIAMRAAGMTKGRLLTPFILTSLLLGVSMNMLSQEVIPYTNREFRRQLNFLTSSGLLSQIKAGQFFTAINGITLFPQTVSPDGRNLTGVFLHFRESDGERVIMAKRGELLYERDSAQLVEKLTLKLFDGGITTAKKNFGELEKILFESYTLPISQNRFSDRIAPKETMLNQKELAEVMVMDPDLALKRYDFNQRDLFNVNYEFWNRRNIPIVCILLTFLGFSLGVKENRGKGRNAAVWGLLCLIAYYTSFFGMVGMAKSGKIPVMLSLLGPNLLLFSLGLYFYRKLDWQS